MNASQESVPAGRRAAAASLACTVAVLMSPSLAFAHSPHDEVVRVLLAGGAGDIPLVVLAIVRGIAIAARRGGAGWRRFGATAWRDVIVDADADADHAWLASAERVHRFALGSASSDAGTRVDSCDVPATVRRIRTAASGTFVHCADGTVHRYEAGGWSCVASDVLAMGSDGADGILRLAVPGCGVVADRGSVDAAGPVDRELGGVGIARLGCAGIGDVSCLAHDAGSGRWLVGGARGLHACDDDRPGAPLERVLDASVTAVHAGLHGAFATLRRDGLARSMDGGSTWRISDAGLTRDAQADAPGFGVPHFGDVAVDPDTRRVWVAGFDGLFASDDAGETFAELPGVLPRTMPTGLARLDSADAVVVSTYGAGHVRYARDAGGEVRAVAQSRESPRGYGLVEHVGANRDSVTVSNDSSRPLSSLDGGLTWATGELHSARESGRGGTNGRWTGLREAARSRVERSAREAFGTLDGLWPANPFSVARARRAGARMGRPMAERIPLFGTRIGFSPDFDDDRTVFLGSRCSGVHRSTDSGATWRHVLELPNPELRGIECLPTSAADPGKPPFLVVVITRGGMRVSDDGGERFVEMPRPDAGERDVCCRHAGRLFVATAGGLYSGDGRGGWESPDARTGVASSPCAAAVSSGGWLLVQFDDGALRASRDGHDFVAVAPAGTPVFRQGVEFPDLAPMLATLEGSGSAPAVLGSDQYGLWHVAAGEARRVRVAARLGADSPEFSDTGRWWRLDVADSPSGQRAYARRGTRSLRFAGERVRVLGVRDAERAMSFGIDGIERPAVRVAGEGAGFVPMPPGRVVWDSGPLTAGVHELRIGTVAGVARLDAVEYLTT